MTELSYAAIAKKKQLKRGALFATLFIIVLLLVSHFMETDKVGTGLTANKSNTLSISGPWEISSLDPANQGYILTRMQVIETLLNVDNKGNIQAGLATQWHNSDDGLTWQFSLREDVVFHDGSHLDAYSVVNALNHATNKHGTLTKAAVTSIDVLAENKIEIILAKPYTSFAALLTNYSNAILSPASYDSTGKVKTLHGSGAYQMDSFSPPHQLTVKQFDNYWGQKASIPFATYLTGHRAESRLLQAKSG